MIILCIWIGAGIVSIFAFTAASALADGVVGWIVVVLQMIVQGIILGGVLMSLKRFLESGKLG